MTPTARHLCARALQTLMVASAMVAATMPFPAISRADTASIDTTGNWDGARAIEVFGFPNTATYGQTITVPSGNTELDTFTFYMSLPSTLLFRGEVYAWDDTNHVPTGSDLYESPQMHTSATGAMQAVTFNTGGLKLSAGAKYILFASISKDYYADATSGTGDWAYLGADAYPGGGFFFLNNGGNLSQWTSASWRGGTNDLVFKAEFSPPDSDLGITAAANITADATSPSGAVVSYPMPTATDEDGTATASVNCAPAPGSTFAIGTTTVNCTATDPDDSNSSASSFTVTVEGASQQLADLLYAVQGAGPGKSLSEKVSTVQSLLSQGNTAGACSTLMAFANEVQAQSGKSVETGTASSLLTDAQRIESVLSC